MPSEHPLIQQAQAASRPKQPALPPRLTRGLHIVALFEAAKGLLVLAGGVGALSLLNRDASLIAEKIVRYLLLNPDSHYTQIFLKRASQVTNQQLLVTATIATLYAGTRFIEAYGLWKNRAWAEWLAVFGGMVYLPFEITAILNRATALRFSLLTINVLIVIYVARVLWVKRQARAHAPAV
ncbi:MAG TPA: DUF2127 domain-containing protein [Rariglobus sp.]|jgi:uncharacterized membrane protein (DUF2068 family)|nr:DUF2127 domain-containing protein [Rariglobus sp.]